MTGGHGAKGEAPKPEQGSQATKGNNGGEKPPEKPAKAPDVRRSVSGVMTSWLSNFLAALKFARKFGVNAYIPLGSFALPQSWPAALGFEFYKLGMVSANFAYVQVYGFMSSVDQLSEALAGNYSLPFLVKSLEVLNAPYRISSMPASRTVAEVNRFLEMLERRRLEKEAERKEWDRKREIERQETIRQAKERLHEFERMTLDARLAHFTKVVRGSETGKVKEIYFTSKKFKEIYQRNAFRNKTADDYWEIYNERLKFYERPIEWAYYKEKIDPDYYEEKISFKEIGTGLDSIQWHLKNKGELALNI